MITLLLATSVLLFFAEGSLDDHALRTKCIIPSVKQGQTTTLTCSFNDDVNDLQKNFKIVRYTSGDEKVVLLCDMSTGKPNCQSEPGYSFAGNENGSLYVLIPRASDIHVGRYSCQLLNSQPDNFESCSFSLKRADTTCTIPAVPVGQNAELTCYFNKNMSLLQTNIKVTHTFAFDDVQDIVLLCHWKDGIPNCQLKDGFVLSGVINNKLIISIPRTTLNHAGDYRCSEQSSADDSADTCSLNLHVFNPEQRTSSDSEVKSEKNEALLENQTILITISIIVALAIVVVVGTISVLYICWKRRTNGEKYSMQRDLENVTQNEENSTHIKASLLGEKSKIYRLS